MRWIDRGPEPDEIAGFTEKYTQGWINYYTQRDPSGSPTLPQPQDHEWSYYSETLGENSIGNCWYCERQCQAVGGWAPTVDHFRPRSLFPELSYSWPNWIFSCRRCNEENKGDNWAGYGYVDPSAIDAADRPDQYFEYDLESGRIIPKSDISDTDQQRAWDTIDDLGLCKTDLVNPRFDSIRRFSERFMQEYLDYSPDDRKPFADNFLSLSPAAQVDFLIFSESNEERSLEYPGLKAMVAEKLLRGVAA